MGVRGWGSLAARSSLVRWSGRMVLLCERMLLGRSRDEGRSHGVSGVDGGVVRATISHVWTFREDDKSLSGVDRATFIFFIVEKLEEIVSVAVGFERVISLAKRESAGNIFYHFFSSGLSHSIRRIFKILFCDDSFSISSLHPLSVRCISIVVVVCSECARRRNTMRRRKIWRNSSRRFDRRRAGRWDTTGKGKEEGRFNCELGRMNSFRLT